jgi:uncharacterized protein (TIGR00251 family)
MHGDNIITLKVLPRSSKNEIIKISDKEYKIKTTAPPVDGAANDMVIKLLSDYFSVSKSCIEILRGEKSKKKTIKITF